MFQRAVIRHDGQVLAWLEHHPFRRRTLSAVGLLRAEATRSRLRVFHAAQRLWTRRELQQTIQAIRTRDARRGRAALTARVGDVSAWGCIHRGEADWSYDPHRPGGNGVYYGGLQMDWGFMLTYGPLALGYPSWAALLAAKGTADRWTPREQMVVAEYARRSGRGYYPWPNTARACGLI